MIILGWKLSPFYDGETKHLEWAVNGALKGQDQNSPSVINLNTRILGRKGVTSAILVVDPQTFDAATSEFKTALETYKYSSSERYEAFRPGDKIAEYGLAALITGGAVAVATKTGFWKVIGVTLAAAWKFVAAGVVAFIAWVRNLFKRRNTQST
jgi:uncharacterized membrane-anchored protein